MHLEQRNNDFLSISNSTLESILPVQFPNSDLEKDYKNSFFPRRKPAKGAFTQRSHFPDMFYHLANVSATANVFLSVARFIYARLPSYSAAGTSANQMSSYVQDAYNTLMLAVTEDNIRKAGTEAMYNVSSGRSHIIVPSKRFNGGYDVVFSGSPGNNYGETSTAFFKLAADTNLPRSGFTTDLYPEQVNEKNIVDLARGIAEAVNKWVTGKTTKPNPAARDVQMIDVKDRWNSQDLLDTVNGLMRKAGLAPLADSMPMIQKFPTDLDKGLGKYYQSVVVTEPNLNVVSYLKHRKMTVLPAGDENPFDDLSLQLSVNYGLSFAMTLPKEFVAFITQTPEGGAVPLTSLNTWVSVWARGLVRPARAKMAGGSGGDRVNVATMPRYVLSPSRLPEVKARRESLGLYAEETRANEDALYINHEGRFNYCPPASEMAAENARNYEAYQEEALRISFEAGAPFIGSQTRGTAPFFAFSSPDYATKIVEAKQKLAAYAGSLQTYSWDYNCILTSSRSDPDKLTSIPLNGAIKPDNLAVSEYLRKPAADSMFILFKGISSNAGEDQKKARLEPAELRGVGPFLNNSVTKSFAMAYTYQMLRGKVPDVQELIKMSAEELGYTTLDPTKIGEDHSARFDAGLYTSAQRNTSLNVMTNDLQLLPHLRLKKWDTSLRPPVGSTVDPALQAATTAAIEHTHVIFKMMEAAMNDASAGARSNLTTISVKEGFDAFDDDHYFDVASSNFENIRNLYNYLGGRVFYNAMKALRELPHKEFMLVDPDFAFPNAPYANIVREVMPYVTFMSKYIPDAEKINEEADEQAESLMPDSSISPEDVKLPGATDAFQMFPHQFKSMQTLGKHPRFATLDIAPGGGKTILGLTDIGGLIHAGNIKRPAVICPNGLVRNWIEDMHSVTKGKWNLIPITTQTYRTWGDERLTDLIRKAPINTIFVIGMSFLRLDKYQVVIGNHAEAVSGTLEFCKKFGFDYIIIDESHKAKNMRSHTHKAIKQLTVSSAVKYVRLATGSLVQNKLTDVVGQAAVFGSHIFRTQEEYEAENSEPAGNGRAMVFKKDTAYRARRQLAKFSAVMSFKKKEWAFLLPRPIETFMTISLADPTQADEVGQAHQMMYNAVLAATLEEIKKNKDIMSLLSGHSEDDDDGDDDDSPDALYAKAGKILGSGEATPETGMGMGGMTTTTHDTMDDSTLADLESALRPYLQRLEMMLTDPLGDEFGAQFFGSMKKGDYVSRKVRKIIERIRLNFHKDPWQKGKKYPLKSVVDFDGQSYVLMGEAGKTLTLEDYSQDNVYVSTIEPNKDPRWKPEPYGKVIVFCRYTRSVNAIYRALPPELKKLAVRFSGEEGGDKWQNLEDFRLTPFSHEKGVQILIANEMAISEGHNLQMASRIVRVESPWSPGELDQSSSRIFRPDTSGQFRRENIYLDWIVCNNTMEVAKMGRLISRMIDKAKFDEADNPLYDVLNDYDVDPISMSLETIAATPDFASITNYLEAYQEFARIQAAEFEEMRQTSPSTMFDIGATEMPAEAAIIEHVPYLPGLKSVPDRHGYGLRKLTTYLQDDEDEEVAAINANKKLLEGSYVHTEFGNGRIVSVRVTGDNEKGTKLSSVTVMLASGDTYQADPAMIYLARNLTEKNVADFTPKNRWATPKDKKRAEVAERKRLRAEKAEKKRDDAEKKRLATLAKREKTRAEKEKSKTASKKAKVAKKALPELDDEEEEFDPLTLDLYPVIYNGYLAVEATPGEDDEKDMKGLGFKTFGDYAFIQIKDQRSFEALYDYLTKKYYLRTETRKRLENLMESFQSGRGRKFAIEMAPIADFKNFYQISHKLSQKNEKEGKMEMKIYPVIINGSLFLNVDVATNPAIRRLMGKAIPNVKGKFQHADGLYIQFFKTRMEVISWSKKIRKDGVEITNFDDFKEAVDGLGEKLKYIQKHAK